MIEAVAGTQRPSTLEPLDVMHTRRLLLAALGLPLVACSGATGAGTEVSTGEAIIQLGDAVSELRQQNAEMQAQLDSIRAALARQDTLIARLQGLPR